MKTLALALLLTHPVLGLAHVLDWRAVAPPTAPGQLIVSLHDLARETPVPGAALGLLASLPAFENSPGLIQHAYVARLTVAERQRLSERWPRILDDLAAREPHLAHALHRVRRESAPETPRRPLRTVVRDFYRRAVGKIRRHPFVVPDRGLATTTAGALDRLGAFVRAHAADPQPAWGPNEDVLEVLGDWPELGDQAAIVARFVSERLNEVDLERLARAYRRQYSLAGAVEIARAWPRLGAALDELESPEVLAVRDGLRGRSPAFRAEADLGRALKTQALRRLGRVSPTLEERLVRARAIEARAVALLRLEEIVREGAEPSCGDYLRTFVRRASVSVRDRRAAGAP